MSNFTKYYKDPEIKLSPTYAADFIDLGGEFRGDKWEVHSFRKLESSTQRSWTPMKESKFLEFVKERGLLEVEHE